MAMQNIFVGFLYVFTRIDGNDGLLYMEWLCANPLQCNL